MLEKTSKLLGKKDLETYPLPCPFESYKSLNVEVETNSGNKVIARVIKPLIKASLIYAQLQKKILDVGGIPNIELDTSGIGIGTRNSEGTEITYVEKKSISRNDVVDLVEYNPSDGNIRAAVYIPETNKYDRYALTGKNSTDGTAIYLALLPSLMQIPDFALAFSYFFSALNDEKIDEAYNQALLLCHIAEINLCETNAIPLNLENDLFPKVSGTKIQQGRIGPRKETILLGEFNVFMSCKGDADIARLKIDPEKYSHLTFEKMELSAEEKLLIPEIPPHHVISEEEVFVLDEIAATRNNPNATKITQIFAEGASSSGKSYLARTIAARLKRPFVSFTFTPNTDESDIKGMLLPVTEDTKNLNLSEEDKKLVKKIYDANDDEINEVVSETIGLPTLGDILLDPAGAYKDLTGIEKEDVDMSECISVRQIEISSKLKYLMQHISSTDSNSGVKYKYIESPIIQAIKNGWFLELQEPSCLLQQGMLTVLFDVLEKDSFGRIETHAGTVKKHPDFMCMITTNKDYKGCKPLNEAARGRFQLFLKMDVPSTEVIMQRVMKKCDIKDSTLARECAEVFEKIDKTVTDIQAYGAITLRNLYNYADAVKRGVDKKRALYQYLVYAATTREDEIAEIEEALEGTSFYDLD